MKTKVALVQMQMSSVYEENIAKIDSFIQKASKEGAKLILLPELFERHYFDIEIMELCSIYPYFMLILLCN